MAKEIVWGRLTPSEAQTLANLTTSGVEVYAAPLVIENADQLKALGLTWEDCKTWHIGPERLTVRLTPSNKGTYDFQLRELRKTHRNGYRQNRCKIPGKQKSLIPCPECNRCSICPYPQYRDQHQPDNISWDGLIESGYEETDSTDKLEQADIRITLEDVCRLISAKDPRYTEAIVLKHYYQFTVPEIAQMMDTTERNVYYFISEAVRIGKTYKEQNQ